MTSRAMLDIRGYSEHHLIAAPRTATEEEQMTDVVVTSRAIRPPQPLGRPLLARRGLFVAIECVNDRALGVWTDTLRHFLDETEIEFDIHYCLGDGSGAGVGASVRERFLIESARRVEVTREIREQLSRGITVICLHYSFMSIARATTAHLSLRWCEQVEAGLLLPDLAVLVEPPSVSIEECHVANNYAAAILGHDTTKRTVSSNNQAHFNDLTSLIVTYTLEAPVCEREIRPLFGWTPEQEEVELE